LDECGGRDCRGPKLARPEGRPVIGRIRPERWVTNLAPEPARADP